MVATAGLITEPPRELSFRSAGLDLIAEEVAAAGLTTDGPIRGPGLNYRPPSVIKLFAVGISGKSLETSCSGRLFPEIFTAKSLFTDPPRQLSSGQLRGAGPIPESPGLVTDPPRQLSSGLWQGAGPIPEG